MGNGERRWSESEWDLTLVEILGVKSKVMFARISPAVTKPQTCQNSAEF